MNSHSLSTRLITTLLSVILTSLLALTQVRAYSPTGHSQTAHQHAESTWTETASPHAFCDDVTEIPLTECEALLALYTATNGQQWTHQDGWLATDTPCTWYGVTCGIPHVTALDLRNNNLSGALPVEIANLPYLEYLNLSTNAISGALPAGLGSLAALTNLNLDSNQLSGALPGELGNLANLTRLALAHNQLSGALPASLGNLLQLKSLSLGWNQLTGSIPAELGNLANLEGLYLAVNQLSGSIPPELGNLAALQDLHLFNNHLTGAIPAELGSLTNLERLYLQRNELSGALPAELGSLENLTELWLWSNRIAGEIPPEFGNLTQLTLLYLDSLSLRGEVPAAITQLVNLEELGIQYNLLSATHPDTISFLDEHCPGWAETQTLPPNAFQISAAYSMTVELDWTRIIYTGDGGYYEVGYASQPGGPFEINGLTRNKFWNGFLASGLLPETTYYFRVRTHTPASGEQLNDLWSDYTPVISATTTSGGESIIYTPTLTATLSISNSQGNTILMQVPAGAFSDPATLLLATAPVTNSLPGYEFIGETIIFAAFQDGMPLPANELLQPVELRVAYQPAQLGHGIEASLALYAWDATGKRWLRLPDSQLNPLQHTVTAQVEQTGWYALYANQHKLFLPAMRR